MAGADECKVSVVRPVCNLILVSSLCTFSRPRYRTLLDRTVVVGIVETRRLAHI